MRLRLASLRGRAWRAAQALANLSMAHLWAVVRRSLRKATRCFIALLFRPPLALHWLCRATNNNGA
jgi:hypothetical protein